MIIVIVATLTSRRDALSKCKGLTISSRCNSAVLLIDTEVLGQYLQSLVVDSIVVVHLQSLNLLWHVCVQSKAIQAVLLVTVTDAVLHCQ